MELPFSSFSIVIMSANPSKQKWKIGILPSIEAKLTSSFTNVFREPFHGN
jgi:hypothetical protein